MMINIKIYSVLPIVYISPGVAHITVLSLIFDCLPFIRILMTAQGLYAHFFIFIPLIISLIDNFIALSLIFRLNLIPSLTQLNSYTSDTAHYTLFPNFYIQ